MKPNYKQDNLDKTQKLWWILYDRKVATYHALVAHSTQTQGGEMCNGEHRGFLKSLVYHDHSSGGMRTWLDGQKDSGWSMEILNGQK